MVLHSPFFCTITPSFVTRFYMEFESFVVDIINEQTDVQLEEAQVESIVKEIISFHGEQCHEVAIHFVPVNRICELHMQFFKDPSQTDCITLPMDDEDEDHYRHLGEVFVCPKTACEYVKAHGGNFHDEILLYVVHGMLHLFGYDDLDDADRIEMRAAENRHLLNLKEKGLCLSPS